MVRSSSTTSGQILTGPDLKKAGLKVTLPRLKILEIFEGANLRHMSAEDIYKELLDSGEDIPLSQVTSVDEQQVELLISFVAGVGFDDLRLSRCDFPRFRQDT